MKCRMSMVFLVIALTSFGTMTAILFPLTVDDSYIFFRYSDNLAHGHGLAWNPGEDPVEGYTDFLWVIIGAALIRAGIDIVWGAKILGLALGVFSVVTFHGLGSRLHKGPYCGLATVLFGCTPALALWSVSGMGTALFLFLLLLALSQFLREDQPAPRRYYVSTLWLLALALARPEGLGLLLSLPAVRVLLWFWRGGAWRKRLVAFALHACAALLLYGIYFAWRYAYFGSLLPNTAYCKAAMGLQDLAHAAGTYSLPFWLLVFPFACLALVSLRTVDLKFSHYPYVLAGLLALTAFNAVSSDWMPGYRLALPVMPLLFLLAVPALAKAPDGASSENAWARAVTGILALGLVGYNLSPLVYSGRLFQRIMARQPEMSLLLWTKEMVSIVDGQYVPIGRWLAEHAQSDATVVTASVGAIGYYSRLRVIDMLGLTDKAIAHNGFSAEHALEDEPEFIVLESDTRAELSGVNCYYGRAFLRSPKFQAEYEPVLILDNGRTNEPALFVRDFPHASWVFARKKTIR